jgi:hypothetical protein
MLVEGMSKADRCSVCVHPARDIIEERILSGEPLKHILKDYSLVLFYHRFVCIEKRDWSELQRPGETDNGDRFPLNLNNRWIINISKRYNYDHFDSVNLGITKFSWRVPQERLYFDLYPVADARIGRKKMSHRGRDHIEPWRCSAHICTQWAGMTQRQSMHGAY